MEFSIDRSSYFELLQLLLTGATMFALPFLAVASATAMLLEIRHARFIERDAITNESLK